MLEDTKLPRNRGWTSDSYVKALVFFFFKSTFCDELLKALPVHLWTSTILVNSFYWRIERKVSVQNRSANSPTLFSFVSSIVILGYVLWKIPNEKQQTLGEVMVLGDGEMWWLRALVLLQRTGVRLPVPQLCGSQSPLIQAPGDLISSSGLCRHLYTCKHAHMQTNVCTDNKKCKIDVPFLFVEKYCIGESV